MVTPEDSNDDVDIMRRALIQAEKAAERGEVPVGAVVVVNGTIIAEAGNSCVGPSDPSGHAEMLAIRQAARSLQNYRLPGASLYVTLEPCPMCAALLVHARLERLVFGATDPKGGGVVSKYQLGTDGLLNHRISVTGGILAEECGAVLRQFFRARR